MRFLRIVLAALVATPLLALTGGVSPATAASPPAITELRVFASDGGAWFTYPPAAGCGIFHLFAITGTDPNGEILNPSTGVDIPLADGTTTYTVIGTDANGPGTTQTLDFLIDGVRYAVTEASNSSATVVSGGKKITVSGFQFDASPTRPVIDRVAVCGVYPDGYVDSYGSFTVTVASAVTAPVITTSANLHLAAGQPGGAVGTYAASAADETGPVAVSCSPASGSLFPVGTTTVSCSATGSTGLTASTSFLVTVAGAAEQLVDLRQSVAAIGGTASAQVDAALKAFAKGDPVKAANHLNVLLKQLDNGAGKKLTTAQREAIRVAAKQILSAIGQ
jgi:hypothetical protein